MIVSIHQPGYWPWLGLLDKIAKSDRFIVLDNVAANKAAYQYRNTFLCNGKPKFITLPVDYRIGVAINDLKFRDFSWREEHPDILRNYYLRAPHFREIFEGVRELYSGEIKRPVDLMTETMLFAMRFLGIETEVFFSSELGGTGSKSKIVLDLVRKASGTVYLSGKGASAYMTDEDLMEFGEHGIDVVWQDFRHPRYSQFEGFDFVEGLACLDLFFFHGAEGAGKIFRESLKSSQAGGEES